MKSFGKIFSSLVLAVGLSVSAVASVDAASLISNEGFETGSLGPWFAESGSPAVTTVIPHTGSYSVEAHATDRIRQNFAATATNLVTEVSIWIQRLGGAFSSYTFHYDDLSIASFLINDLGGSDDWEQFDLTGNLAVGKNLTGFSISGTNPGPAYFDDVVISTAMPAVPVPASLPLMFIGLGGLLVIRRRKAKA